MQTETECSQYHHQPGAHMVPPRENRMRPTKKHLEKRPRSRHQAAGPWVGYSGPEQAELEDHADGLCSRKGVIKRTIRWICLYSRNFYLFHSATTKIICKMRFRIKWPYVINHILASYDWVKFWNDFIYHKTDEERWAQGVWESVFTCLLELNR